MAPSVRSAATAAVNTGGTACDMTVNVGTQPRGILTGVDDVGLFIEYLGLRIREAGPDRVVAEWTARPELHQPYGIVHGGAHSSVVETLASLGAGFWFGRRGKVVGVSNTTEFYRAVSDGELVSVAEPVHRGRSQQVWVVRTEDADGRLIARGQVRLQNLADPAASPA